MKYTSAIEIAYRFAELDGACHGISAIDYSDMGAGEDGNVSTGGLKAVHQFDELIAIKRVLVDASRHTTAKDNKVWAKYRLGAEMRIPDKLKHHVRETDAAIEEAARERGLM